MFVLITGLPASGKTTAARAVCRRLAAFGLPVMMLDGDEFRELACKDLGFDMASRDENLRRARAWVKPFYDKGTIIIASFVAPLARQRLAFRLEFTKSLEVFMDTPLEICRRRDPKGMYRRAYAGLLPGFTGVGSTYERPAKPDLAIHHETSPEDAARLVCSKI